MKKLNSKILSTSIALLVASGGQSVLAADEAGSVIDALKGGKFNADFRLRYENVDQTGKSTDADALTLRSRLGYTTSTINGFSAKMEVEDSRIVGGVDDYTVGPTGFNPGEFPVIADPETTEVDQAYLQYKNGTVVAKLGRQVITYDNHRFIGHVGWRQDRQTYDAFSLALKPADNISISYNYIDERERIFAEDADIDSDDHLLNASIKTAVGKLTGYAYLLENEDNSQEHETFGVRFNGSTKVGDGAKVIYTAEFASQEFEQGTTDYDADYFNIQAGLAVSGFTFQAGYEVLGSDDGNYIFSTPLATLHAHNGWADMFIIGPPPEGLVDMSLSVAGKLAGGKFKVVYHQYEADEASPTMDDLGDEINLVYSRKFGKNYSAGIKYAAYSADDFKADTDKLWVWFGVKF